MITGVSRKSRPAIRLVAFRCAAISGEPRYVLAIGVEVAFAYFDAFQIPFDMYAAVM